MTTSLSSATGCSMPKRANAALPEDCKTHFDLLRAAKRAGRHFGLGPQDLQLLELYLCFTRPGDWVEGGRPLYSRPVHRTAADLGVTPRSVNTAERRLERLGLIRRATRADGARGGWHEGEGAAYGIELAPLAEAYSALEAAAERARADAARIETLRAAISIGLGEGRRILAQIGGEGRAFYDAACVLWQEVPERTPQSRRAEQLEAVLEHLNGILARLIRLCGPVDKSSNMSAKAKISSDAPEEKLSHIYNTTNETLVYCNRAGLVSAHTRADAKKDCTQATPTAHGLQHIKGRDVVLALPAGWEEATGNQIDRFEWRRFCYVAELRLSILDVSVAAWREACSVMGREAAAVSLMILDANRSRSENPVRNVGGALRAMTRRAERGALRLHASVYGLKARAETAC